MAGRPGMPGGPGLGGAGIPRKPIRTRTSDTYDLPQAKPMQKPGQVLGGVNADNLGLPKPGANTTPVSGAPSTMVNQPGDAGGRPDRSAAVGPPPVNAGAPMTSQAYGDALQAQSNALNRQTTPASSPSSGLAGLYGSAPGAPSASAPGMLPRGAEGTPNAPPEAPTQSHSRWAPGYVRPPSRWGGGGTP